MDSSRRTFLKTTAVGAGIAWTAPQIISMDAAAAATALAPLFLDWAGAHSPSGATLVFTLNTGAGDERLDVAAGDYVLAFAANHIDSGHGQGPATPTGWSQFNGTVDSTEGGQPDKGVRTRLFGHEITAADITAGTLTFDLDTNPPVASTAWTVVLVAFSGVDTATPLNPAAPATAIADDTVLPITVGGISPVGDGVVTLAFIGSENPVGPWSEPAAYAELVDYAPNTSVPEIYVGSSYTSTSAATFTGTASNHPKAAWMLGLAGV